MSMSRNRAFDLDEALNQVDGDLDMFLTLAELFVEHGPKDCAAIKAALGARDSDAVAKAAHRLKGAVLQFCAPATFEAAQKLEELGKAGDMTEAGKMCVKLEMELLRLVDALRRTLDKGLAT
jgi:HPt (histidine-containing phosphotransfer) domain-containing protein